jgi:glycosyltransferase involved in cell wall biosynthesis
MMAARQFAGHMPVVIPTYNERDSINPITDRVRSAMPGADLLIVDDNSPDMTGKIADELAAAEAPWRVTRWGIAERLREHHGKNLPARQSAGSGLARNWSNDHRLTPTARTRRDDRTRELA